MTSSAHSRRAQGVTEYIIVVGLVAIVLVSTIQALRSSVATTYGKATLGVIASMDSNDPSLFPVSPGNPYRWNNAAGVWMDSEGVFVGDSAVSPFEANPARFRD